MLQAAAPVVLEPAPGVDARIQDPPPFLGSWTTAGVWRQVELLVIGDGEWLINGQTSFVAKPGALLRQDDGYILRADGGRVARFDFDAPQGQVILTENHLTHWNEDWANWETTTPRGWWPPRPYEDVAGVPHSWALNDCGLGWYDINTRSWRNLIRHVEFDEYVIINPATFPDETTVAWSLPTLPGGNRTYSQYKFISPRWGSVFELGEARIRGRYTLRGMLTADLLNELWLTDVREGTLEYGMEKEVALMLTWPEEGRDAMFDGFPVREMTVPFLATVMAPCNWIGVPGGSLGVGWRYIKIFPKTEFIPYYANPALTGVVLSDLGNPDDPGTPPVGTAIRCEGLKSQIVGTGTTVDEMGNEVAYFDVRFFGTITTPFVYGVDISTESLMPLAGIDHVLATAHVAVVGGSKANISGFGLSVRYLDDNGNLIGQAFSIIPDRQGPTDDYSTNVDTERPNLTDVLRKFVCRGGMRYAAATHVMGALVFGVLNNPGAPVDITLRFGGLTIGRDTHFPDFSTFDIAWKAILLSLTEMGWLTGHERFDGYQLGYEPRYGAGSFTLHEIETDWSWNSHFLSRTGYNGGCILRADGGRLIRAEG
ncbi:MAG: hypothetical protein HC909_01430 [Blastochloris sp.]|nr:hypothetical protein [Blastochloris sp.]